MDIKQIQELIRFVSKSGVSEVNIKDGEFEITIKTQSDDEKRALSQIHQNIGSYQAPPQYAPQPIQVSLPPAQPSSAPVAPPVTEAPKVDDTANLLTIKSPMIGTFYRKPGPDKDLFIKVGDRVEKGQVVCIIEAMKLFNEIESEVSGTVVKILVDDSSPVEYDQPLVLVQP